MTVKPAPAMATWFLNQFGARPENESVIGDLLEQYQRGSRSAPWYWRQVLSIVFGSLLRDIRGEKKKFVVGLFHTWLVWGGVQLMAGLAILAVYALNDPAAFRPGITVAGLPILHIKPAGPASPSTLFWIRILALSVNLFTLAAVGRVCARIASTHSRSHLLAFAVSYIILAGGSAISQAVAMLQSYPEGAGIIFAASTAKIAFAITMILFGGLKGLPAPWSEAKR